MITHKQQARTASLLYAALIYLGLGIFSTSARAAEVAWTNALGGNWSTASNWSTGTVPDSSDNVSIALAGNYSVTLDADARVNALVVGGNLGSQTLVAGEHTLTLTSDSEIKGNGVVEAGTINGSANLTNSGILKLNGGTIALYLINKGRFDASGGGNVNGSFESRSDGSVQIQGGDNPLVFSGGFNNAGEVQVMSSGEVILRVEGGKLENKPDGNILVEGGGQLVLEGELDNQGTLTCGNGSIRIDLAGAAHLNSGTFAVTGGSLAISADATFSNQGTIEVSEGNAFTLEGSAALENGGTLKLSGGTINASVVNAGQVESSAGGNINGTFTTQANGAIHLSGEGALTFSDSFTNEGSIRATASGESRLRVESGPLTNEASATITAEGSGQFMLEAVLQNQGTLTVAGGTFILNKNGSVHANGGTISVTGGDVVVSASAETKFVNTGIIEVSGDKTFAVTGGTFELTAEGRVQGSGSLDVSEAVFVNAGTIDANISVIGTGNRIPVVASALADTELAVDAQPLTFDLSGVFQDADGDSLSFSASSSNAALATARVSGNTLTVAPAPSLTGEGRVIITITAQDGRGGSASTSFDVGVGVAILLKEDFDGDGQVAFSDFVLFAGAFGSAEVRFDLDVSGSVDFNDFLLFVQAFGKTSGSARAGKPAVPETAAGDARLSLISQPGESPDRMDVAVRLDASTPVEGYQLDIAYDPARLEFVRATTQAPSLFSGNVGPGAVALQVSQAQGELILADVLQHPIEGDETLLYLTFRRLAPSEWIDIRRASVLDTEGDIRTAHGARLDNPGDRGGDYVLSPNFPNPFNPSTQIAYQLPEAGTITLSVYNSTGQLVRNLVRGHREAGAHSVTWDGTDALGRLVASGVYLYRLTGKEFVQTRRMLLLK